MAITKIQSESLNLADTYAFTGTVTGTPNNTPYFRVNRTSSAQAVSSGADTTVQFNNTIHDSGSHWDSTNYRWTPSAGKYWLHSQISVQNATDGQIYVHYIRKGTTLFSQNVHRANTGNGFTIESSAIITTDGTENFDVRVYFGTGENIEYDGRRSFFEGFKIAE